MLAHLMRARALPPLALALALIARLVPGGTVQAQGANGRSMAGGVYTVEQAARGETTFRQACAFCHATAEFARTGFFATWTGSGLYGLFDLIRTTMPQDDPGRLPAQSYAAVLAYLLSLNGYPAGTVELPVEADALKQIRVDPAPAGAQRPTESGGVFTRSSRDGVYTTRQATAGQERYALMCQGCHTVASHTGPAFVNVWNGRPLSELFDFIRETMPKGDPGVLTPDETVELVAYLLKMNRMPAGSGDLPSDPAALKTIRFHTGGADSRGTK